jgi:predicted permease
MGPILEVIGWVLLIAVCGALFIALLIVPYAGNAGDVWMVLSSLLSYLFGSILIIAFGQAVAHLKTMKDHAIRQTEILERIAGVRSELKTPTYSASDISSRQVEIGDNA